MPDFDAVYLDPADKRLITGTPQEQERARREFARQREIQAILRRIAREIPRSDLIFGRWVEVASTGELFHPWAGDVWFAPVWNALYRHCEPCRFEFHQVPMLDRRKARWRER